MALATILVARHAKDGDGKRETGGFSSVTKQNSIVGSSRTWRYTIVEAEATIETLQRTQCWMDPCVAGDPTFFFVRTPPLINSLNLHTCIKPLSISLQLPSLVPGKYIAAAPWDTPARSTLYNTSHAVRRTCHITAGQLRGSASHLESNFQGPGHVLIPIPELRLRCPLSRVCIVCCA